MTHFLVTLALHKATLFGLPALFVALGIAAWWLGLPSTVRTACFIIAGFGLWGGILTSLGARDVQDRWDRAVAAEEVRQKDAIITAGRSEADLERELDDANARAAALADQLLRGNAPSGACPDPDPAALGRLRQLWQ